MDNQQIPTEEGSLATEALGEELDPQEIPLERLPY
jgi:hypothetical protein